MKYIPNGDGAAYGTTTGYEAEIISGTLAAADGELSEVAWFRPAGANPPDTQPAVRALVAAIGRI